MANRGEGKTQKSISAPKVRGFFPKKQETFTPKTRPGPHNKENSVPLSFFLRNVIGITENQKETKRILVEGSVLVNGVARKGKGFSIGLFDLIEVPPLKKKFRVLFDTKGRLIAKEAPKAANFKVSKVVGKRTVKGGKTMITTNDGFNITLKGEKVRVEDSVRIAMPQIVIEEIYPMEKGSSAFVVGGVHTGKVVKIEGVVHGSLKTHTVVELAEGDRKFQTVINNVMAVGKGKPAIEALE